jgi:Periplasmic binding protein
MFVRFGPTIDPGGTMRFRVGLIIAVVVILTAVACGGGKKVNEAAPGGTTNTTASATSNTRPASCDTAKLSATDVGVTADTITVTVMADTGSTIRPGLFQGSVDGVKAWGNYINDNGGLACRKIVVKEFDSKLSPGDAKNGVAAACGNSLALVGTTALFLQDVSAMEKCKDKAGKATGIPDIAELQTEVAHQCSKISFAALPTGSECPYSGTGERGFRVGYTQYDYYLNNVFQNEEPHGVYVIPKDLPSTISASMPIWRAQNKMGFKSDAEFGISGLATQPEYTPVAQALKQNNSNYARANLDYKGTVLMRKEAKAQGVDSVKVWDCSLQCYDERTISEAAGATEDQYVWINFLPLEDGKDANAELAGFLEYSTKSTDGFAIQGWIAGEIFARAINDTMKANGDDPNSITRENVLTALNNMHDFDANGLTPKVDIGGRRGSVCLVGMQVKGGKFVRVSPTEPGKFDCGGDKPPLEFRINALEEYKG